MPLIEGTALTKRFAELTNRSDSIDIAVAWARPCAAIGLLQKSGAKIRAAVGISNNFTYPSTLRGLLKFAELRLVPDVPGRIFHPKYYCFRGKTTICWVGSANLTGGGFGRNEELVQEFEIAHEDDQRWFEHLWKTLQPDPVPILEEYENKYKEPKRASPPPRPNVEPQLPLLTDIKTWDEYVKALRKHDDYCHFKNWEFDVLGETDSWLHTIKCGNEVIRRAEWSLLTKQEYRILSPPNRGPVGEESLGLLGWVRGGGAYVFNPKNESYTSEIREQIQVQVTRVLNESPSRISKTAHDTLQVIKDSRYRPGVNRGIGPAAASRWLALARPDCLVSVNRESAAGLGAISGLPQTSGKLADKYTDLIDWVRNQPWFNSPAPNDSFEREIWDCRGALLDVFFYVPARANR